GGKRLHVPSVDMRGAAAQPNHDRRSGCTGPGCVGSRMSAAARNAEHAETARQEKGAPLEDGMPAMTEPHATPPFVQLAVPDSNMVSATGGPKAGLAVLRHNDSNQQKDRRVKGRESGMPEEAIWEAFFQPESLLASLDCCAGL